MSRAATLVLALLMSSLVCGAVVDETSAGDAAHFLRNGLGARQRSMGGACTALSNGMAAAFWNPAPVVQSDSTVVGGELENRNLGLFQFSYLGGGVGVGNWGFGTVVLTSDIYNMYLLSGGYRIGQLVLGLGVKSYRFGIPGDRGTGIGLDSGIRWTMDLGQGRLALAAVSRDIGWTEIRWTNMEETTIDRTAWVNRVAAAVTIPVLTGQCSLEADLEFATKRPPRLGEEDYQDKAVETNLSLGVEVSWSGIYVRAGLQRYDLLADGSRLHPTFGIGIALDAITIDLAIVPSFLGSTYLGGFQVSL
ncbi:hypothetical protein ACFLS5_02530 [Candidatus Bipolaricaulota bacterium]